MRASKRYQEIYSSETAYLGAEAAANKLDVDRLKRTEAVDNGSIAKSSTSLQLGYDYRTLQAANEMMDYNGEEEVRETRSSLQKISGVRSRDRNLRIYAEEVIHDNDEAQKEAYSAWEEDALTEKLLTRCISRTSDGLELKDGIKNSDLEPLKRTLEEMLVDIIADKDDDNLPNNEEKEQIKAINQVLDQIDRLSAMKSLDEAPRKIMEITGDIYEKVGSQGENIRENNWDKVDQTNLDLIAMSNELREIFVAMRDEYPDMMLELINEIGFDKHLKREERWHVKGKYKRALINFVRTHNVKFTSTLIKKIPNSEFGNAFLEAYTKSPERDDAPKFIQKTSGIPQKKFDRIIPN